MKIINLINDYWPAILAAGALLDALAGYLPDKWVPYLGLVKRLVTAARKGKAGTTGIALLMVGLLMGGCASLQLDPDLTEFTIETMAMGVGYELQENFEWTPDVQTYYDFIMAGNVTVDGARAAEEYLRTVTHPLIANRMVTLAGMVGFDLDVDGSVIGVDQVKMPFLQAAARGFKGGLELE